MPIKRAGGDFLLLKIRLFRLEPLSSDTTALSMSYLKLGLQIIPAKSLFFKSQKVAAASFYDIEIPLPDTISKLRRFSGLLNATCWLSSATGS